MYHELGRTGRVTCRTEPGYRRYVVPESRFRAQIEWLAREGIRGVATGEAVADRFRASRTVAMTFDDGCETDAIAAAPVLATYGMSATFYIVTGWIGRTGFLNLGQIRELAKAGFEVGSHTVSHAFLTGLDDVQLRYQLRSSRDALEQAIGAQVHHLSCPGGRWSRRVARAAIEAGYQTIATSRAGVNGPRADLTALARLAIHDTTSLSAFGRAATGAVAGERLRQGALDIAKILLGSGTYERLRDGLLGRRA
jgi:peptidoglycan/xylan/chitin deacetylase (PgdA/CDA1 family)